jgi:hypothetical protein
MAEDQKPSKNGAIALGIAAAVGAGTFFLMRKRMRVCYDLPEIWSPEEPLHLTDEAQQRAELFIAKRLRNFDQGGGHYDAAKLLVDVANHLQECRWEEIESARATQVYQGLGKLINSLNSQFKEDKQGFLARYGL